MHFKCKLLSNFFHQLHRFFFKKISLTQQLKHSPFFLSANQQPLRICQERYLYSEAKHRPRSTEAYGKIGLGGWQVDAWGDWHGEHLRYSPPGTNSSHLKIVTWKTIVSCWNGLFSSAMFILGGVENLWNPLETCHSYPKKAEVEKVYTHPMICRVSFIPG